MSYIPPNIIVPKEDEQTNLNNNKIVSNKVNGLEDEEKKIIKNSNIDNNDNLKFSKSNQKLKKANSLENIFKKEELNKSIKIYSDEEIMHYVHLIFLNNSLYFPKKQQYLMTTENLIKIIKNFGIIPKEVKLYELDIIVKKVCPKANLITYENFMDILIKIAEKLFPKEYKKNKVLITNFFFHNIFLSFNEIIFDNSTTLKDLLKYQYSSLTYLLNIIPEDSQILVMNSLLYTLNEIYEKYFIYNYGYYSNNKNNYIYENGNLNNLFNFCRDFEIMPFIISETQIVTYYNLVVDNNELFKFIDESIDDKNNNNDNNNGYFTFNNFILFFIHLAEYNYTKVYESILYKEKNVNELRKLIMLLTRLECSKGMRNLIDNSLPNLTLMPNRELFLKYNFENELNDENNNNNMNNFNKNNFYGNNNDNNFNINNINNEENNINKENIEEKKQIGPNSSINFYNPK